MNNFTETIRDYVIEQLAELKGYNKEVYASDLAYELTEGINVDGSVHCSTYKAKEFIKNNFDDFGGLVNYCKSELDTMLNPFSEPEKAEVIAYIEGTGVLLNNSQALQAADEASEYQTITLTDELIDAIVIDLNNANDIEF